MLFTSFFPPSIHHQRISLLLPPSYYPLVFRGFENQFWIIIIVIPIVFIFVFQLFLKALRKQIELE